MIRPGPPRDRNRAGPLIRPAIRLILFLLLSGLVPGLCGCTLILAGSLIHAVVAEVKSRQELPEKNEILYVISADDREQKTAYMVEVYVKTTCDTKRHLMLIYVNRIILSYVEKTGDAVVLEDLEGDGYIDVVKCRDTAFFPPVPYSSGEYMLKKSNGGLRRGEPEFDVGLGPDSPWYGFSERTRLEDPAQVESRGMNVYPLQERFTRIAVPALKELDFTPRG